MRALVCCALLLCLGCGEGQPRQQVYEAVVVKPATMTLVYGWGADWNCMAVVAIGSTIVSVTHPLDLCAALVAVGQHVMVKQRDGNTPRLRVDFSSWELVK